MSVFSPRNLLTVILVLMAAVSLQSRSPSTTISSAPFLDLAEGRRWMNQQKWLPAMQTFSAALNELDAQTDTTETVASQVISRRQFRSNLASEIGWAFYLNGNPRFAQEAWTNSIKDFHNCGAIIGITELEIASHQFRQAGERLQNMLNFDTPFFIHQQHCRAEAAARLARIARLQNRPNLAIAYADRGRRAFTKHLLSHLELARAHIELRNWKAAKSALSSPWARRQPQLIQLSANVDALQGRPRQALKTLETGFQKLAGNKPVTTLHEYLTGKARIEMISGTPLGAIYELEKIPAANRQDPDTLRLYAEANLLAGDYQTAFTLFQQLAPHPGAEDKMIIAKSRAAEGLGNIAEAEHILLTSLQLPAAQTRNRQSSKSALLIGLGDFQQRLGMVKQAKDSYLKAISAYPPDISAHASLGLMLAKEGYCEESKPYLQEALERDRLLSQVGAKLNMCENMIRKQL